MRKVFTVGLYFSNISSSNFSNNFVWLSYIRSWWFSVDRHPNSFVSDLCSSYPTKDTDDIGIYVSRATPPTLSNSSVDFYGTYIGFLLKTKNSYFYLGNQLAQSII